MCTSLLTSLFLLQQLLLLQLFYFFLFFCLEPVLPFCCHSWNNSNTIKQKLKTQLSQTALWPRQKFYFDTSSLSCPQNSSTFSVKSQQHSWKKSTAERLAVWFLDHCGREFALLMSLPTQICITDTKKSVDWSTSLPWKNSTNSDPHHCPEKAVTTNLDPHHHHKNAVSIYWCSVQLSRFPWCLPNNIFQLRRFVDVLVPVTMVTRKAHHLHFAGVVRSTLLRNLVQLKRKTERKKKHQHMHRGM